MVDRACSVEYYKQKNPPDRAIYPRLAAFSKRTHSSLHRSPIKDELCRQIGRLTSKTKLTVGRSKINGTGVRQLAGLKNLRQIDFTEKPLDDVVFDGLVTLERLETLFLDKTRVAVGVIVPSGADEFEVDRFRRNATRVRRRPRERPLTNPLPASKRRWRLHCFGRTPFAPSRAGAF